MTYEYDNHGIKCLNDEENGYRPVEPHCVNCGYKPDDCECVTFCSAPYWDEEGERWIEEEYEDEEDEGDELFPCPDCEYCKQPKTWKTTRYIKSTTFMNKDACVSCYEASDEGYEASNEDEE